MRLNPYHPQRFWSHLARAFLPPANWLSDRGHQAISAPTSGITPSWPPAMWKWAI
jgi:hypothetical protein